MSIAGHHVDIMLDIMSKQVEELEKEKKELGVWLKAQDKKQDHIERTKRYPADIVPIRCRPSADWL
jgi:hypothetical protein